MALMTKDIGSLDDLFTHMLRDIYYAENKIVKSLPKMIDKSHDSKLKKGLSDHLEQTRNHVSRLEKVFDQIGAKAEFDRLPGDRRDHQGSRRAGRRDQGSRYARCGDRRRGPGHRAL